MYKCINKCVISSLISVPCTPEILEIYAAFGYVITSLISVP